MGLTGPIYFVAALAAGVWFWTAAVRSLSSPTKARAKRLFFASIIYLPVLMIALAVDVALR